MFSFLVGMVALVVALVVFVMGRNFLFSAWHRLLLIGLCVIFGFTVIIYSTSLWVSSSSGGLITKKFGDSLKGGHIIAVNGERGVQADILSPGWSFAWAPWQYDLQSVPNITIAEGNVGIVTAMDGQPLPAGEVYAPEWKNPTEMIDARIFLTKGGCRGPQLTVLPPGQYRFNPMLFDIKQSPCVDIAIGVVGVVRANAGLVYAETGTAAVVVNGIPLVPKGYKGIWDEPLMPGKYYLHPNAYQVVKKKTTKRMYSYTGKTQESQSSADRPHADSSIPTRSSDGFSIPVDVRVTTCVKAEHAPYVVARFADPDAVSADGYETLETLAILPSIRALLRNAAQNEGALQFVQKRSVVEQDAFEKFKVDMAKDKIEVEAVYLADIRLDATPEGQALLKTQTDKQIADQQQQMYQQQVKAETERAQQVKAMAAADQQKRIQESLASIEYEKNNAEAAKNKAVGEAAAYEAKVKALGGVENFTKLEIAKLCTEAFGKGWKGLLPEVLVTGGGTEGSNLLSAFFAQQLAKTAKQPAAP
jgi:regulator of protease activity HflC (stomatin/prohibitin superfamily)